MEIANWLIISLIVALIFGAVFGPALSLHFGGLAFVQHWVLRLVCTVCGAAPLRYARFLDYAAERILLSKVGGSYIFIHRMLLEYFAEMPDSAGQHAELLAQTETLATTAPTRTEAPATAHHLKEENTMPFTHGHALVIGVGADLPTTIDDAQGLADILHDPARCAYPAEQVQVLTGEQATRDNILAALEHLTRTADEQATVIVYFSGHGYRVNSGVEEAYYLMPHGYDAQRLAHTAISGSEFASRLRAMPAQKLVLLLDCCHAGGVGEAKGLELAKAPLPPEAEHLLAEGRGRVLIASSREDERSYAGTPYSAFTLALIEALCGVGVAKADSYVRVADLAMQTRQMVPGRTHNKQHPVLHFEQADNFVLAYYAGGAAQPKALPFTVEPEIEPEPGTLDSLRLQQTISGTASSGGDNSGQQTGINYGNMTQSTQTIHNKAANEGAQGTFHGPVSFNRQHTAFDQRGQNVGGNQHNAAGDINIGQPQQEPSRPRLSDMRLVQVVQAALEQQSLDDVLFALEGYASFTPDAAALGAGPADQARALVQQCRSHKQRHALIESLRDFEDGLLGTPEEEAAWLAWARQQDNR